MFWRRFTESGCMNASAAVVGMAAYALHLRRPQRQQDDITKSLLLYGSTINFVVAIALRMK